MQFIDHIILCRLRAKGPIVFFECIPCSTSTTMRCACVTHVEKKRERETTWMTQKCDESVLLY